MLTSKHSFFMIQHSAELFYGNKIFNYKIFFENLFLHFSVAVGNISKIYKLNKMPFIYCMFYNFCFN